MNRFSSIFAGAVTTAISGATLAAATVGQGVFQHGSTTEKAPQVAVQEESTWTPEATAVQEVAATPRVVYVEKEPVVIAREIRVAAQTTAPPAPEPTTPEPKAGPTKAPPQAGVPTSQPQAPAPQAPPVAAVAPAAPTVAAQQPLPPPPPGQAAASSPSGEHEPEQEEEEEEEEEHDD